MKLGHIGVPVKDTQRSKVFYDAIVPHIGLKLIDAYDDFVGYGEDDSYLFYLHKSRPAVTGVHICFETETKEQVEAFHASALSAGGTTNGEPGIREQYDPTYFAAFVFDPDGNNIEVLCRN